jgi:DnaJ-class molecular chaperone
VPQRAPTPRPAGEPAPVRKASENFNLQEQPCPRCDGSGHEPDDPAAACRRCNGAKKLIRFSARPA